MTDAEKGAFLRNFVQLVACYNQPVMEGSGEAYFQMLRHLSLKAVLSGMSKASGESQTYFPTAPQIRAHAAAVEKSLAPYTPPVLPRPLLSAGRCTQEAETPSVGPQARAFCHEASRWRQEIDRGIFQPPPEGWTDNVLESLIKQMGAAR